MKCEHCGTDVTGCLHNPEHCIAALRAQLHAEREARRKAERERDEAREYLAPYCADIANLKARAEKAEHELDRVARSYIEERKRAEKAERELAIAVEALTWYGGGPAFDGCGYNYDPMVVPERRWRQDEGERARAALARLTPSAPKDATPEWHLEPGEEKP